MLLPPRKSSLVPEFFRCPSSLDRTSKNNRSCLRENLLPELILSSFLPLARYGRHEAVLRLLWQLLRPLFHQVPPGQAEQGSRNCPSFLPLFQHLATADGLPPKDLIACWWRFLMSDCRWLEISNHLQSDIKKRWAIQQLDDCLAELPGENEKQKHLRFFYYTRCAHAVLARALAARLTEFPRAIKGVMRVDGQDWVRMMNCCRAERGRSLIQFNR